jgi:hypothetical protein
MIECQKSSNYSIMNESNAAVAETGGLSVNQALHLLSKHARQCEDPCLGSDNPSG